MVVDIGQPDDEHDNDNDNDNDNERICAVLFKPPGATH
jgi:hypothetical protein